jgi:hypothetical protein
MQQFEDPNDIEYGGGGEELFDLLETCDNFVVLVIERNVEGVDFYLLQCQ